MKSLHKTLTFICTIILSVSCIGFERPSCDNPKTDTLTGTVTDNLTLSPIKDAIIEYYNIWDDFDGIEMTFTDVNGKFNVASTMCTWRDEFLMFDEASHPEYDQYINITPGNYILMFNTEDFKIIMNNTKPGTENRIYYKYSYCVREGSICHNHETPREYIDAQDSNTITLAVVPDEIITFMYKLNLNSDWTSGDLFIENIDEFTIEY